MAFGLSPKHTQELSLDNLTPEQFLVISIEAAKKLDWNIGYVSETGFVAYTGFSMSSYSEEVTVKIEGGNATLKSECTGNQITDWGKNKKNIETLVDSINELKTTLSSEELAQKYEELKPDLVSKEEEHLNQPPPTTKGKLTDVLAIFKPTNGYFITPIIIDLNIILFILMVVSGVNAFLPDNESLIKWGANFKPVTLGGEWWRLITNCFLHIGIFHLLMNMYALLYIGLLLEPHLGKTRFLAAYFLTGITASITSLWWHDLTISAGASGAIFGMYGVFLSMLTTNLIEKSARQALLTSIALFVGYNLINGLKGGIDNAGGLIGGLIVGYAYYPGLKKPDAVKLKYAIIGMLSVVILSISFVVYKKLPNDIGQYDEKIKLFATMEENALKVFELPQNASKEQTLAEINKGNHYWNESIKLLTDLDKLHLPDVIHTRNKKLIDYCNLRINVFNLMYKGVEEGTSTYNDSIEAYNKKIETIIKGLSDK